MSNSEQPGLDELVRRGGVFSGIPGNAPRDVLTNLVNMIPAPASVNRDRLLEAVLEREALMSTTVGHGLALPHPRNPLITSPAEQLVTIAFLKEPVDWNALDGKPVHTILLIVSASARLHLHTLSRINFFCQREDFRGLLENRASLEEITGMIAGAERTWR
ncbi:MAG: PTS sugar transporter subunit IIA [Spirochaetaceae bacterium]|jgi:PTS system nitrogen regulatory IIA component|nr:PTS sugar transporter subunit IIA [Spirochaetaceae bacterium]